MKDKPLYMTIYLLIILGFAVIALTPNFLPGDEDSFTTFTVVPGMIEPVPTPTLVFDTSIKGNCVDKATTVLNILNRHGDWDDIYAAVSKNHVQIARVETVDGVKKHTFLEVWSLEVKDGKSDFNWGEPLEFYEPALFLAAAEKFKPTISLAELKEFAREYKL